MNPKLASLYHTAWGDPARLVQYLFRLLNDDRVSKAAKLKLLGSGLYAWLDGDLLPDRILGFGLVDDVVLVIHGIRCLISETDPAVAMELWPGDETSYARTISTIVKMDETLFGNVKKAFLGLFNRNNNRAAM